MLPVVVLDEDNGGSDHFPIVIDVVVQREEEGGRGDGSESLEDSRGIT